MPREHGIAMIADARQREIALDISRSFVVQAPAGSGKTELLVQRFMKLLARVDRPERVLAITFTRKATREMQDRVLLRLRQASGELDMPEKDHERAAVALAADVLGRDAEQGWDLLHCPQRLNIRTIDGFCGHLAGMEPGLAAGVTVQDDARPLYREAARELIERIGERAAGDPLREALVDVLVHLDGDAARLQGLVADMLPRRDQWLPRMGADAAQRDVTLAAVQAAELEALARAVGATEWADVEKLVVELSAHVEDDGHPARRAASLDAATRDPSLALQRASLVAQVICTKDGTLLQPGSLANHGFGRKKGELQQLAGATFAALEDRLAGWRGNAGVEAAIGRMARVAPWGMDPGTGQLLEDLRLLLLHAGSALLDVFDARGQCDHQRIAELALQALGTADEPGGVLLREDQRIEHVMLDEFQDTSVTQFELLRRLVAGWTPDDGRTLFLVGDPMQSIYRFREADVSLITKVMESGQVGDVPVEALRLSTNFRSREELVGWVNLHFEQVFDPADLGRRGAVGFAPGSPAHGAGGAVHVHAMPPKAEDDIEAEAVVDVAVRELATEDTESVAVLARSRKHLAALAEALTRRGVPYEAVKVRALKDAPVVMDLLAITRALCHPFDRVAWLALLRAPWAGLTAAELVQLLPPGDDRALPEQLVDRARLDGLDQRSRRCVERLAEVMEAAAYSSVGLARRVEAAWTLLGGAYSAGEASDLANARKYLALLAEIDAQPPEAHPGDLVTVLTDALKDLYAESAEQRLKLMTIHQAKGLEFDVVLLPGLHRGTRSDDPPLLRWEAFPEHPGAGLLLAPLPPRGASGEHLYAYLAALEKEQQAHEERRVLYVAATRARRALHVFGTPGWCSKSNSLKAPSNKPMELLWHAFEAAGALDGLVAPAAEDEDDEPAPPDPFPLLRLVNAPLELTWRQPAEQDPGDWRPPGPATATALGGALHLWLELAHDVPGISLEGDRPDELDDALAASLAHAGAPTEQARPLVERLRSLLAAAQGRAGLAATTGDDVRSFAELRLFSREGNALRQHVVDLVRVNENGEREIVDYKTGTADDVTRAAWSGQLGRYTQVLSDALGEAAARRRVWHWQEEGIAVIDFEEQAPAEKEGAGDDDG